jgi:hypothetical protein
MNPSTIRKLITEARGIKNEHPQSIPAFVVAWVGWEALRTRMLRVVIQKQGWKVVDIDQALKRLRISSMKSCNDQFIKLGLIHPCHWQGKSGKVWQQLHQIENIRHRLVHGYQTIDPQRIFVTSEFILASLEDRYWIEQAKPFPDAPKQSLGCVLEKLKNMGKDKHKTHEELVEKLDIIKNEPAIPSLIELKQGLTKLFPNVDISQQFTELFPLKNNEQ